MDGWSIGEVARRAGVAVDTVRFYEREGLIPRPARTPAGYRQYPAEAVERLRFIRRAKEIGFSLGEIAGLLDLAVRPGAECAAVRTRAEAKLSSVEAKIRDLESIRAALTRLVEACGAGRTTAECPILDCLGRDVADTADTMETLKE